MWMLVVGFCFSPLDAAMSVAPEAFTPATELIAAATVAITPRIATPNHSANAVPASQPTPVAGLCENPFDPRCSIQPGLPAPQQWQGKHSSTPYLVRNTIALLASSALHHSPYKGTARAGHVSRLERPPRAS